MAFAVERYKTLITDSPLDSYMCCNISTREYVLGDSFHPTVERDWYNCTLCNPLPQVTLQLSHGPQDDQPLLTIIVSEVCDNINANQRDNNFNRLKMSEIKCPRMLALTRHADLDHVVT